MGVEMELQTILLGCLLFLFAVITVVGNALVIISVIKETSLQSPTHFFIASLAFADLFVGLLLMPLEAITEVLDRKWIFGETFCDIWRAIDVFLGTASILNLSVISLDRYWAISKPFIYHSKMTYVTAAKLIISAWFCSAVISFPGIAYWRFRRSESFPPGECLFTEDPGYLIASSCISFYIPLVIMLFTYLRIYRAAIRQTRSLSSGSKTDKKTQSIIRMHRGGRRLSETLVQKISLNCKKPSPEEDPNGNEGVQSTPQPSSPMLGLSIKRKLSKFSKEKKAAKTLAIVLGVFMICWCPFFVLNLTAGFCPSCKVQEHILFPIFTWLGWVNSAMNPFIYAAWNPDFRRYE